MKHIASDERAELTNYITEIVEESLPAGHAAPLPTKLILNVAKSGFVRGGLNATLKNYDAET